MSGGTLSSTNKNKWDMTIERIEASQKISLFLLTWMVDLFHQKKVQNLQCYKRGFGEMLGKRKEIMKNS